MPRPAKTSLPSPVSSSPPTTALPPPTPPLPPGRRTPTARTPTNVERTANKKDTTGKQKKKKQQHQQPTSRPQQKRRKKARRGSVAVLRNNGGRTARTLLRCKYIRRAHDWFIRTYGADIPRSGVPASPRVQAARAVTRAAYATPISTAAALLLVMFLGIPLGLAALAIIPAAPAAVFFAGRYGLRDTIRKRGQGADAELFFFVIFCDIIEKTGRGIYGAFEIIAEAGRDTTLRTATGVKSKKATIQKQGLFPAMYRESLIIRREMHVFARSFADMLHEIGHTHPSVKFRDFIRGYAVASGSGGVGTVDYLSEKLREYHVAAKQRMSSYISTTEMLATVGSFGLVMFPMLIVVGGILADPYTLLYLCAFGIVLIPIVITILIKKARDMSPIPAPTIPLPKLPLAAAGAVAVVMAAALTAGMWEFEWWECAAITLAVWALTNYMASRKSIEGGAALEKSIPDFIRDIGQKTRSNPSFFAAFTATEKKSPYTRQFNHVLRQIKSRMSLGVAMSDAMRQTRSGSWLADCVMRLMAHASSAGAVTPAVLERLAMFASHHQENKQEMAAKTVNSLMTGYMGSVIVVMMLVMIPSMSFDQFGAYNQILDDTATGITLKDPTEYDPQSMLGQLNMVLVIVGAFCSMTLIAQIRYATVLHSLHTGILLAVLTIILWYDEYVGIEMGGGM